MSCASAVKGSRGVFKISICTDVYLVPACGRGLGVYTVSASVPVCMFVCVVFVGSLHWGVFNVYTASVCQMGVYSGACVCVCVYVCMCVWCVCVWCVCACVCVCVYVVVCECLSLLLLSQCLLVFSVLCWCVEVVVCECTQLYG